MDFIFDFSCIFWMLNVLKNGKNGFNCAWRSHTSLHGAELDELCVCGPTGIVDPWNT